MKLKSTLWALAFACAAVSCSDDLNDNPNTNGNGNETSGETTFMKVSVNPAVTTRAGGEEGDTEDGEVGEANEYTVNDVTVVLYRNADDEANEDLKFSSTSVLVAAGYVKTPSMNIIDEDWHKRMATVEITVTSAGEQFDGKTYGIIAVTNLGSETVLKNRISSNDLNTGAKLANFLQEKAWSGTGSSASGFIMSTHNDTYGTGSSQVVIFDKITLKANATAENAPEADVHVERLAAKIRINEDETNTDFIYSIKENNTKVAKVRLDQVVIVNKQDRGSYLLKRVTSTVGADKIIPVLADNATDSYLGNETADNSGAGTNYVIDPWTRNKNQEGLNNITGIAAATDLQATSSQTTTLSYANPFADDSYAELWESIENGAVTLAGNTSIDAQGRLFLDYTLENTTSAAMSKNGYSTGALFKATYFPKAISKKVTTDEKTEVKPVPVDYNGTTDGEGFDDIDVDTELPSDLSGFYVYSGNAYDSYETIFDEFAYRQQKSLDGQTGVTIYDSEALSEDNITNIKVKTFLNSLLAEASDPLGYINWLKNKYQENESITDESTLTEDDTISAYIEDEDKKEDLQKTFSKINYYENCVMYYPYWIRHADNGISSEMGVMEFGIVRNNIYDLTVTGVGGYGASGIDKPEPDKDNETNVFLFNVRILVKNWVVRKNSGIIL